MESLRTDLRHAARALRRSPAFAAIAILTLALGIGANTALFAVVDGVLLRPLPFRDPGSLLRVWSGRVHTRAEVDGVRERARTLAEVGAYAEGIGFSLTGGGEALRIRGAYATANLAGILGIAPAIGAGFRPEHERPESPRAVMLSDGLWRTRFGGDAGVIGRAIELNGVAHTVVGVLPADVRFPLASTQLWVAATFDAANPGHYWGAYGFHIIARTRPGITPDAARADVAAVAEQMRLENPLWRPAPVYSQGIEITPLLEDLVADVRGLLLILLAATAAVLLIACVNVANLSLSRAIARERELTVRAALGAGRGRIARQLLAESMLLALAGGALGLAVAHWGLGLLRAFLPADTPRLDAVAIDPRVLAFAIGLSALTAILFGLVPALRVSHVAPARVLADGARGSGIGRAHRRLSRALVMGEVALAVVLVAGAMLLLQSFWRMRAVEPGFQVAQVLTARLDPIASRYREPERQVALWESITTRVAALPGVREVAAASRLPFDGVVALMAYRVDGAEQEPGNLPMAYYKVVTPGYLDAVGIPVVRGRALTAADRAGTPDVVLVNEAMVRRFWPNEDPVGQRIGYPWPSDWLTVVGVVRDTREGGLAEAMEPAIYRPFHQAPETAMSLVIRLDDRPAGADVAVAPVLAAVREIVASVDPDVPVSDVRTMEQRVADEVSQPRVTATLLLTFAGIALLLGAIGIYGVIAYAVTQRTRELGIRMALGARRVEVLRMVVREGLALAAGGVLIGVLGAVLATRVLRGLLFGIEPGDPATLAMVSLLLVMVAMAASLVPARRAARVDPMISLRAD